ncbi:MAG: helix-turn-helix transcriptional regulator [Bacteroidales bacterium]|nr:helix-turn-helix transcriptional regulator [Bacteroidales bacterium]
METLTYQDITLKLAPLLDALSHPARLQIVLHLAKYNNCPAHSISNRLPICKSTVSKHMSKLKEVGLITSTSEGICQNYRLNDENILMVREYLLDFYNLVESLREKRTDCRPLKKDNSVCNSN